MKIYTSYFYKVRFFTPNMIPISTAKWDPKWYHDFKGEKHQFIDKNGVINGLRAEVFAPGPIASQFCRGTENCYLNDPHTCLFLRAYRLQLDELNFDDILSRTETLCKNVRDSIHYEGEPIAVFLVHEAPDNPCSERAVIQEWFKSHGIDVVEWEQ